ncbi:hypothetical protein [Vulcaniibacterium tengchongense]|uniref:Uncharacterized protein n=1 Tax=Vulcaniibacterium tengchongense TaxID=1273429 RepID=A0A3N4VXT9_9GAMM|nr:hypothetical protein [Vulcaniibacterium tengchongense]RPE81937.1 hypothetical protein EDC50_1140 [Vulcaniibacterium tengchongense]
MRGLDFGSWEAVLSTLAGLVLITLMGVGIRLLLMQTVQQRRERENRQINERLRTLIAAYRTLGGSFTGDLEVDPAHLRDLRRRSETADADEAGLPHGSDRSRRIRDAVEGALSDILLLGTDEQVRLAARAAADLVAGRRVHTAELVVSLRDFIREVLDLDPIPRGLEIPRQGPTRPGAAKGRAEGGREAADRGGAGGGRGAGAAGGMGLGMGLHLAGSDSAAPKDEGA